MTDLDAELRDLLVGHALAERFAAVIGDELLPAARELFGDRATAWVVATLRTTADVLERLDRP